MALVTVPMYGECLCWHVVDDVHYDGVSLAHHHRGTRHLSGDFKFIVALAICD